MRPDFGLEFFDPYADKRLVKTRKLLAKPSGLKQQ
jgi:hypothetical protein